jgi:hypothetical protein
MGFFSFLKEKRQPSFKGGGIEPLKLDINLPPIHSIPSSAIPETPEVPSFNLPPQPTFDAPSSFRDADSYKAETGAKDLSRSVELISSKLDTIKAMLENLNHRLDKLEGTQKKETIKW